MSAEPEFAADFIDSDSPCASDIIELRLTRDPCRAAGLFASAPDITWGMEMNVARLPIWTTTAAARPPSTTLLHVGTYLGEDAFVTEPKGSLTVEDHALNAHLTKALAVAGYPSDGCVLLPAADGDGDQVEPSLERLSQTTIESKLDFGHKQRPRLTFKLYDLFVPYDDSYLVYFSRPHVALLRGGQHTPWLDSSLYLEMRRRDEHAPILWAFLRSQKLSKNWAFSVFGIPSPKPRFYPLIAHLLGYQFCQYRDRGMVAGVIAGTAATVCEVDYAYTARLVEAKGTLAWNLVAQCVKGKYLENVKGAEGTEARRTFNEGACLHPKTTTQELHPLTTTQTHIP